MFVILVSALLRKYKKKNEVNICINQRLVNERGEKFFKANGNILLRIDFTVRFLFSYVPPKLIDRVMSVISKYLTYLSIGKSTSIVWMLQYIIWC